MTDAPRSHKLTARASYHLDMLRGVSALLVLVGHLRALFFVDPDAVTPRGWLGKLAYRATGLGSQAVVVFFVLSGFLVGGSVLRAHASQRWSWKTYLIARASRLYVVLLPALLLTAAWDSLGQAWFGTEDNFYGGVNHGAAFPVPDLRVSGTARTFVGNLLFLQPFVVPCFGTNGPLWSLSLEAVFYLVFPLVVAPLVFARTWRERVLGVAAMLGFALLCPIYFRGFSVWLLGAAVAFVQQSLPAPTRHARGLTVVTGLALLVAVRASWSASPVLIALGTDRLLGLATALFLWSLVSLPERAQPGFLRTQYERLAHGLSEMSYSLYALHFPALIFASAALVHHERWQPSFASIAIAGVLATSLLGFAYAVSRCTESRTPVLRRWLESALGKDAKHRHEI